MSFFHETQPSERVVPKKSSSVMLGPYIPSSNNMFETAQSPPMLAPSLQPSCEVGPVEQQHGAAVPTRIVHKQSHLSMCE